MEETRLTPLMGIASVVLFMVAIFVIEAAEMPEPGASGTEIAAYLDGALGRLAVALFISGLGTLAFIWFLDGLRTYLSRVSDQLGRLMFHFGFGVALFRLAALLPDVAGALASDERELEGAAAEAITSLGNGFFIGAQVMLVGLLVTAGLAIIRGRGRALPTWVGWIALALATVAMLPPIGLAVLFFSFPLWILLVSALLLRPQAATVTPPPA